MAPLRPRSAGGDPAREFPKGFRESFRFTSPVRVLTILRVMPEECSSGAPLESMGAQGSVVAAAYRGDPTGDFPKGFLGSSSALLEGTIPKTITVWYAQISF